MKLLAWCLFWSLAALAVTPSSSWAQTAIESPADVAQARVLFVEAVEHMTAERWTEARAALRRALVLHDAPNTRWNLASCESELGHLVEAVGQLRAIGRATGENETLAARALERAAALEARIAHLTVVTEDVHGLQVRVDGERIPNAGLGVPRPIDPGARELVAEAPGRARFELALELLPAERRTIHVELPRIPNVPFVDWVTAAARSEEEGLPGTSGRPVFAPPPTDGGDGVAEQWWFWTGLGTIVAGIVAGSIAAVVAASGAPDLPGGPIETRGD